MGGADAGNAAGKLSTSGSRARTAHFPVQLSPGSRCPLMHSNHNGVEAKTAHGAALAPAAAHPPYRTRPHESKGAQAP